MSPITIEKIIDDYNQNKQSLAYIIISKCGNIEYTKVWHKYVIGYNSLLTSDRIYFIKDNNNNYIGAVQVMEDGDLFCYIKKEFRKHKYAFVALSNYIIPHQISLIKGDLKCTFTTPEGKSLGQKLGFSIKNKNGVLKQNQVKKKVDFQKVIPNSPHILPRRVTDHVNYIVNQLEILKDNATYAEFYEAEKILKEAIQMLNSFHQDR